MHGTEHSGRVRDVTCSAGRNTQRAIDSSSPWGLGTHFWTSEPRSRASFSVHVRIFLRASRLFFSKASFHWRRRARILNLKGFSNLDASAHRISLASCFFLPPPSLINLEMKFQVTAVVANGVLCVARVLVFTSRWGDD